MGMFEEKPFDEGTIAIAEAVAEATENGATSIVGGGDSVSAINQAGLAEENFAHLDRRRRDSRISRWRYFARCQRVG